MTDANRKQKRNRKWSRFSLRSFLIVVTMFGTWIGWYVYRAEQQREAVHWVRANGGSVKYQFERGKARIDPVDGRIFLVFTGRPPGPRWLHDILGIDYFASIVEVELSNAQISEINPIAGLTNLEYLPLNFGNSAHNYTDFIRFSVT